MANSIKYVNYRVIQNGNIVNSGTIPSILTFSGAGDFYNLGGIWLWFRHEEETILEIEDNGTVIRHPSSRTPHTLKNYLAELYGDENILQPY